MKIILIVVAVIAVAGLAGTLSFCFCCKTPTNPKCKHADLKPLLGADYTGTGHEKCETKIGTLCSAKVICEGIEGSKDGGVWAACVKDDKKAKWQTGGGDCTKAEGVTYDAK